jgi:hypothetical protein
VSVAACIVSVWALRIEGNGGDPKVRLKKTKAGMVTWMMPQAS